MLHWATIPAACVTTKLQEKLPGVTAPFFFFFFFKHFIHKFKKHTFTVLKTKKKKQEIKSCISLKKKNTNDYIHQYCFQEKHATTIKCKEVPNYIKLIVKREKKLYPFKLTLKQQRAVLSISYYETAP